MAVETAQKERFRRHANHHFASHARLLPAGFSPRPRSSNLRRRGFERIARGHYRKDFSGVMELRYLLKGKKGICYDWIMNTENFGQMNEELETIQMRTARETRRLRKIMKAEVTRVFREGAAPGEFVRDLRAAAGPLRQEVAGFRLRYGDFLGIVDVIHTQGPYPRSRCVCFDACTTTQELGLFTEFITLYTQVFGDLRISRSGKALSTGEVREAMVAYRVYYAGIRKIRHLWRKGTAFEDIQKRFATISGPLLENTTEESGSRGWKYRAQDLALELASEHSGTTAGNLRQILKADKVYARKVKEQVATIRDIEKVLNHTARVPTLWPFGPRRQQEEQVNQIIRSVLRADLPA